ncbi:hypothetical protein IAQ61_001437 [Plenodomus lingam]|uniref:uncharacterized protein n=1 Tax=Leptosphaeria maculans TaxID=5022 RepID=UPI003316E811|nr:hypothetical protein IAQ61_001437 [Plenodomus lingam]
MESSPSFTIIQSSPSSNPSTLNPYIAPLPSSPSPCSPSPQTHPTTPPRALLPKFSTKTATTKPCSGHATAFATMPSAKKSRISSRKNFHHRPCAVSVGPASSDANAMVGGGCVGVRIVGVRIVGVRIVGVRILGVRIVGVRIVGVRDGALYVVSIWPSDPAQNAVCVVLVRGGAAMMLRSLRREGLGCDGWTDVSDDSSRGSPMIPVDKASGRIVLVGA